MSRTCLLLPAMLAIVGTACAERSPEPDPTAVAVETETEAAPPTATDPFVGGWQLVDIERRDGEGTVVANEGPGSVGYLFYDDAGAMGVVIQREGRSPYAGDRRTPEEALEAFSTYTSYFGTYSVDEEHVVTHRLQGSLRPGQVGAGYRRRFAFDGDRLTLSPPPADDGSTVSLTWERLPEAELSETAARFVGFWSFVEMNRTVDGGESEPVESAPVQNGFTKGFISYTSSGHMAVHLMRGEREPFADGGPTPEEADSAMSTYYSYFGPFTVHPDEGYIVHHRIGVSSPDAIGTDAQRFFEISDERLILKPPAAERDGQSIQSALTWQRIR